MYITRSGIALFLLLVVYLNCLVAASSLQKQLIDKHVLKNRFQIHSKEVYAPAESGILYPVPNEKYGGFFMKMPLDHFNNTGNNKTFYNKYWVNTDYYKPNGPIILYNVGESDADESAILVTNSTMAQLAEKLNGIILIMEHRFYGSSGPNVTTFFSHTKEDLETFNAKQALADMAYMVSNIKFHNIIVPPVPQTKVIVYGCSYSGALAAWAKDTYPNLFFAAVSSSAPVQADIDFYEYFDPIIKYGPKHCVSSLQGIISYVDDILFNGSTSQVSDLKKLFYSQNLLDVTFGQILMGDIAGAWQYGINSTYNEFEEVICKLFPESEANSIEVNLISYSKYINSYSRNTLCNKKNEALQKCLVETNQTATDLASEFSDDNAAWMWQTCTEFGFFQASPPAELPTIISRKFSYTFFIDQCQILFSKDGVPSIPNVAAINNLYKGWNIELNRTIWIDGEWDSWRKLSVNNLALDRKFDTGYSTSIIIPGATHCFNVAEITKDTPQYLVNVFTQQYQTLYAWLHESV